MVHTIAVLIYCALWLSGFKLKSLSHRRGMCCCRLVPRFEALLLKATAADLPLRVVVVGGGAAGVELACALQYRWATAPHGQCVHPLQLQALWLAVGQMLSQSGALATAPVPVLTDCPACCC